jgi:hypothetical protein
MHYLLRRCLCRRVYSLRGSLLHGMSDVRLTSLVVNIPAEMPPEVKPASPSAAGVIATAVGRQEYKQRAQPLLSGAS